MRIFILSSGNYGKRIVNNLASSLSTEIVGLHEVEEDIPEFIEDLTSYLPNHLPESDLIIAVGLKGDINLLLPEIARKTGASSIIISLKEPGQVPPGLRQEIMEDAGDINILFARPFCSLKPTGNPFIDEFTENFGQPILEIDADHYIKRVKVIRDTPCGCTSFIAGELEGVPIEEAEFIASDKFHNYPCLASMAQDSELGDTILHVAGYQTKEAVKKALGFTDRSAVVYTEDCLGGEDCDHLCRDICPQVKTGHDTITIDENGKAHIDPASCGCCELCIKECPHGAIELAEEKFIIKK